MSCQFLLQCHWFLLLASILTIGNCSATWKFQIKSTKTPLGQCKAGGIHLFIYPLHNLSRHTSLTAHAANATATATTLIVAAASPADSEEFSVLTHLGFGLQLFCCTLIHLCIVSLCCSMQHAAFSLWRLHKYFLMKLHAVAVALNFAVLFFFWPLQDTAAFTVFCLQNKVVRYFMIFWRQDKNANSLQSSVLFCFGFCFFSL